MRRRHSLFLQLVAAKPQSSHASSSSQSPAISFASNLFAPKTPKAENPPTEFLCPIGLELMIDPVITIVGQTYERKNIETWFKSCIDQRRALTDAKTGTTLENGTLVENVLMRGMCLTWKDEHPDPAAATSLQK
ncbi:MAG: hypothetical protein COB66_00985 [Coxiella sp. (in: Bacteria)]|nr:MAG: hypothetical protein COB66_00985 [Coxiella sp. (in: g-proteobacteria)]